jgi:hypothetical protein
VDIEDAVWGIGSGSGSGSGTTLPSGGCHHTSLARNCGEGTEATRTSMREDCAKERRDGGMGDHAKARKACMEGLYGRFLRPLTVTPSLSHGQRSNSAIALESDSVCHDCRPAVHVVLRSVNMRPVPANIAGCQEN